MRKVLAIAVFCWTAAFTTFGQAPAPPRSAESAPRRVALVVGNSLYDTAPLSRAANDARGVAAALREIGFEAIELINGDRTSMVLAISQLGQRLRPNDIAFVYYAGYVTQIDGTAYLLPVTFNGRNDTAIRRDGVSLETVQRTLQTARGSVVVVDAPMVSPFASAVAADPRNNVASVGNRLGALGTIVVLSHTPGQVSDSPVRDGLLAGYVIRALRTPGMTAVELVRGARSELLTLTSGQQQLTAYGSVDNNVVLNTTRPSQVPPSNTTSSTPPIDIERRQNEERLARQAEARQAERRAQAVEEQRAVEAERQAAERRAREESERLKAAASSPRRSPEPPRPSEPTTLTVPRFVAVEAPANVEAGREFALVISVSEVNQTPEVRIEAGARTTDGRLALTLPASERETGWDLDVAISAPAFSFRDGSNTGTLHLPQRGESTPILFRLTPNANGARTRSIFVTLWYRGGYLGKVARDVTVGGAASGARTDATVAGLRQRTAAPSAGTGLMLSTLGDQVPDLTIWENPDEGEVIIDSPYLQPARGTYAARIGEMAPWIRNQLDAIRSSANRGLAAVGTDADRRTRQARLDGFGAELYERFAPRAFKDAYWRLRTQLGDQFDSMLVLSSNPLVPWELMRPADGTRQERFLGVELRLGRWHVARNPAILDRPPQALAIDGIVVLAPAYDASRALPAQSREVAFLRKLPGFRSGPRRRNELLDLVGDLPPALVHFVGHGRGIANAADSGGALVLEDGDVDPLVWKGALGKIESTRHPFVFFNACDVGQTQRRANFVEGWAPAVLETGAAGFVGGLWPLADAGAAQFAEEFYTRLFAMDNPTAGMVAEALRVTRARFYATGDPTYLAYAYYGDPNLRLRMSAR